MQLNFGFMCFVLLGATAAATAAFHLNMDGMYSLDLADKFAVGLSDGLVPDYAGYLNAQQEQYQLDGADEEGEGKGKGKGKGKGRGKGKGKGKGKGGEGGGDAESAFESLFE